MSLTQQNKTNTFLYLNLCLQLELDPFPTGGAAAAPSAPLLPTALARYYHADIRVLSWITLQKAKMI